MKSCKLIKFPDHFKVDISCFHAFLLSCLIALISIINSNGGILYEEMYTRLPYYLSDIPLLQKLFDSQMLDDGLYRARELSYLFDFIDVKFVELCIEHGYPHFLSLTHYLLCIATGCIIWSFCVKILNLSPLTGIGWLVLFWTSPSVYFSGYFINRTGKVMVMFLTSIIFYFLCKAVVLAKEENSFPISKIDWFLYSISMLIITFLDEQGAFLCVVFFTLLLIWHLIIRQKEFAIMIFICLATIILHGLYRFFIAPHFIFALNGYRPDFSYQILPMILYVENLAQYLQAGFFLYLDTFRFLIGNPPLPIGFILLILLIFSPIYFMYANRQRSDNYRKYFGLALGGFLITNVLLVIMNSLMLLKHPPLNWPEARRVFYWLPTTVILVMTLSVWTRLFHKSAVFKFCIVFSICLAVVGNIVALPKHKAIIMRQESYVHSNIQSSSDLLKALKNLYALTDSDDPVIEKNPVFQFFKLKKKD